MRYVEITPEENLKTKRSIFSAFRFSKSFTNVMKFINAQNLNADGSVSTIPYGQTAVKYNH